MIKEIYSNEESNRLLHLVHHINNSSKTSFLTDPEKFIQLSFLKIDSPKKFDPHYHLFKNTPDKFSISQECLIVYQGKIKVLLYDLRGNKIIYEDILLPGDCSITFEGGSKFISLEENSIVFQYANK